MPLHIAQAQAADIPDIVRLNGLVQTLHAALHPDIFLADWESSAFEEFWLGRLYARANVVAIARLDGHAVGYIWFELQNHPPDAFHLPRRRLCVHHLAVDDNARGAGIGAMLLEHAEGEAERLGISTVVLDAWTANTTAQEFFNSRGYDPVRVVRRKVIKTS